MSKAPSQELNKQIRNILKECKVEYTRYNDLYASNNRRVVYKCYLPWNDKEYKRNPIKDAYMKISKLDKGWRLVGGWIVKHY